MRSKSDLLRLTSFSSAPTLRIHVASKRTLADRQKRLHAQYLHSRNVSVLLLSELHWAGAFAGLDSETRIIPMTHQPMSFVGFLVAEVSFMLYVVSYLL